MTARASNDLRALYRTLSPKRRRQLFQVAVLVLVTAAAEMLMIASVVPFLSSLGDDGAKSSIMVGPLAALDRLLPAEHVAAAATMFVVLAIAACALRLLLTRSSLAFAADLGHELNVNVQSRLLHQPYLFHTASHSSRTVASLEKVDQLVHSFAARGLQAVGSALIGLAVVTTLILIDPLSVLFAMVLIAGLFGAAMLWVRRRFRSQAELIAEAHERRIRIVQENLAGIRDIIIDQSQDAQLKAFQAVDREYALARSEISFLGTAPRYIVEAIGIALLAAVAMALAGRPGGLPAAVPVLGAFALGAQRLLPLAGQMYGAWVSLIASRPLVREITALLQLPLIEDEAPTQPLPFERAIELQQISFHYPDRSGPALHDIDLVIRPGTRTAIVGHSGSGKSTLADLLMGLLEPTSGQIRVDGTLLSGSALSAWRQSVAHVPQSVFVADATIARNISLGVPDHPLDMKRIRRAAAVAQLDDFVNSLPQGYDTAAGERGVRLSGGQRQRLALARAIYKQSPMLVLDEATSSLDDATEAAVLAALDELQAAGCTIVVIAHRLSTVERCDRIFMLDQGSLVQSGSYTELFGRLNRLQVQGAL